MTNPSQWQVIITPNVKKRLAKLRRPEREKILQALIDLKKDPFHQDVKPLKGRPEWRLRVGGNGGCFCAWMVGTLSLWLSHLFPGEIFTRDKLFIRHALCALRVPLYAMLSVPCVFNIF